MAGLVDSRWCDASGAAGDCEDLDNTQAHACARYELGNASARFFHTYYTSLCIDAAPARTLITYADAVSYVLGLCVADADMQECVFLEYVLAPNTLDAICTAISALVFDATYAPPPTMHERISRAMHAATPAVRGEFVIKVTDMQHLHVDTSDVWPANNGWSHLTWGLLGAGSGTPLLSAARLEYLICVPRGINSTPDALPLFAQAKAILEACKLSGLVPAPAPPPANGFGVRPTAAAAATATSRLLASTVVDCLAALTLPTQLALHATSSGGRLTTFLAHAAYAASPAAKEEQLVAKQLLAPDLWASLPHVAIAFEGVRTASEARPLIEQVMQAAGGKVRLRLHDLNLLESLLRPLATWMQLAAVKALPVHERATTIVCKLREETAVAASLARGVGGIARAGSSGVGIGDCHLTSTRSGIAAIAIQQARSAPGMVRTMVPLAALLETQPIDAVAICRTIFQGPKGKTGHEPVGMLIQVGWGRLSPSLADHRLETVGVALRSLDEYLASDSAALAAESAFNATNLKKVRFTALLLAMRREGTDWGHESKGIDLVRHILDVLHNAEHLTISSTSRIKAGEDAYRRWDVLVDALPFFELVLKALSIPSADVISAFTDTIGVMKKFPEVEVVVASGAALMRSLLTYLGEQYDTVRHSTSATAKMPTATVDPDSKLQLDWKTMMRALLRDAEDKAAAQVLGYTLLGGKRKLGDLGGGPSQSGEVQRLHAQLAELSATVASLRSHTRTGSSPPCDPPSDHPPIAFTFDVLTLDKKLYLCRYDGYDHLEAAWPIQMAAWHKERKLLPKGTCFLSALMGSARRRQGTSWCTHAAGGCTKGRSTVPHKKFVDKAPAKKVASSVLTALMYAHSVVVASSAATAPPSADPATSHVEPHASPLGRRVSFIPSLVSATIPPPPPRPPTPTTAPPPVLHPTSDEESTYLACRHGWVLAGGQLDKGISSRCQRLACVQRARAWYLVNKHTLNLGQTPAVDLAPPPPPPLENFTTAAPWTDPASALASATSTPLSATNAAVAAGTARRTPPSPSARPRVAPATNVTAAALTLAATRATFLPPTAASPVCDAAASALLSTTKWIVGTLSAAATHAATAGHTGLCARAPILATPVSATATVLIPILLCAAAVDPASRSCRLPTAFALTPDQPGCVFGCLDATGLGSAKHEPALARARRWGGLGAADSDPHVFLAGEVDLAADQAGEKHAIRVCVLPLFASSYESGAGTPPRTTRTKRLCPPHALSELVPAAPSLPLSLPLSLPRVSSPACARTHTHTHILTSMSTYIHARTHSPPSPLPPPPSMSSRPCL